MHIFFLTSFRRSCLLFLTLLWYFVDEGKKVLYYFLLVKVKMLLFFINALFSFWKTTDFLCWFSFCLSSVYLALWHSTFSRIDSLGNYSFWGWWWHILQMYLLITLSWIFKNYNKPPTHTSINVFFINFFLLKLFWLFYILWWKKIHQKWNIQR